MAIAWIRASDAYKTAIFEETGYMPRINCDSDKVVPELTIALAIALGDDCHLCAVIDNTVHKVYWVCYGPGLRSGRLPVWGRWAMRINFQGALYGPKPMPKSMRAHVLPAAYDGDDATHREEVFKFYRVCPQQVLLDVTAAIAGVDTDCPKLDAVMERVIQCRIPPRMNMKTVVVYERAADV